MKRLITTAIMALITISALNAQVLISGYNFNTNTTNAQPLTTPYAANHGSGILSTNFSSGNVRTL